MKSKCTQKTAARKQPYQKKGGRAGFIRANIQDFQTPSGPGSPSSSKTPPPCPSLSNTPDTAREVYVESFQKNYPNMEPRNDYELLKLAQRNLKGTTAEIRAQVDAILQVDITFFGTREAAFTAATRTLDTVVAFTGRKPRPNRDIIHTRPIPGTKFSIRLWPGNPSVSEYCMDFVDTATNEAVNSPFEFELWAVPDPDAPWLSMPSGRLSSLERNFGVPQHKIEAGAEKWVLRDGQTCLLKRPGQTDVLFRVPTRKKPQNPKPVEYVVLDFPREV